MVRRRMVKIRFGKIFPWNLQCANDNEESIFAVQTSMNTGSTNNANWFDDPNYPYNTDGMVLETAWIQSTKFWCC